MDYIIKLFSGGLMEINQEEYKKILQNKNEKIFLSRLGRTFDKKIISEILPYNDYLLEIKEQRKKQQIGILHDGTKVVKHFGKWVKADTSYVDDNNNLQYECVEFDYSYYPELAKDEVKTPEEYTLWLESKKPYLLNGNNQKVISKGDFEKI